MTKERNKPCPIGIEAGENLARFADVEEAKWREKMDFVPVRCKMCAFRKGTFPNSCLTTQADALKCTMERIPFYCAHQAGKPVCGGWMMLHSNDPPVEAPWKFSDEYTDADA